MGPMAIIDPKGQTNSISAPSQLIEENNSMATSKSKGSKTRGSKKSSPAKASAKKSSPAKANAKKRTRASRAATATSPVQTSFSRDIVPLFRTIDVQCMRQMGVLLVNYVYMANPAPLQNNKPTFGNANNVLRMLKPGALPDRMPLGGPYWSTASLNLFQEWIDEGCPP